jgi:hypothetical protein
MLRLRSAFDPLQTFGSPPPKALGGAAMSIFEYFMVLLSVVLSLTLTKLVTGVGELIQARSRVRWSIGYAFWLIFGLALVIDVWTSLWLLRGVSTWSLVTLVFLLLWVVSVFLFVQWLLPDRIGDEPIDLHAHLLAQRRLFLGAVLAYCVGAGATNILVLPTGAFDLANYAVLFPAIVITATAWWSPAPWVQRAAPIAMTLLWVTYFATYFRTIG